MRYSRVVALLLFLSWFGLLHPSAGLVLTATSETIPIDSSALRKIEPQVLRELLGSRDGQVKVIVQFVGKADLSTAMREQGKSARRRETVKALKFAAARSQRLALENLEQSRQRGKVEAYQSLWIINGAAVKGDRDSVFEMAARPEVEAIRADRRRYLSLPAESSSDRMLAVPTESQVSPSGVEWNISKVRADAVWSALGIDGSGAVVASLDTGADWQHAALTNQYRGNAGSGIVNHNGNWYDFTSESYQYPFDRYGHGTHVTGIMVGSEGSNQIGVAPGAKWIAAKVFAGVSPPYADDSWIHAAFQWILAPGDPAFGGDPDFAPDVVNASWGSPNDPWDQTFKGDIEALLAAGIVPVFAAGNDGSSSGTVDSPASLDVAFAVGATTSADGVAGFSSRGPSPWGKTKPEVSAPGVSVRSAYPGGTYAYYSGTSMATPHVAGLLALLKQANPSLTPLQALGVVTSTAVQLGEVRPNNDAGWGRIDAYAAVSMAAQFGGLSGSVRGAGGITIAGATVTATNQATGSPATSSTGQNGSYSLSLAPGFYDVKAGAFGYAESSVDRVAMDPGGQVVHDFTLNPLPTGLIVGTVKEEGTGIPLTATVTISGTSVSTQAEAATGAFTLTVPAGTYDIRAASQRHRLQRQTGVTVAVSATTTLTFSIATAPSILVVDSGAWYSGSKIGYYSQALDQLDYLYSVRPISDTRFIPTASEMAAYDVVIWSSPLDSPGYIGADTAVAQYLDGGGRLLLSGQDIGYWDGGGEGLIYAPYFSDRLHARFLSDNAGINELDGVDSGIFQGITLTLNTADSAHNQLYPDIVAPRDIRASSVMNYQGDGSGGVEADVCLPYRVVYLGFGLEGVGPASNRQALIDRTIEWLVAEPVSREVRLMPTSQSVIAEPGSVATGTVTVWNAGSRPDTFTTTVSGGNWPTSLWDESFSWPITSTGEIASCGAITVGIKVEVPDSAGKNEPRVAEFSLVSLSDPTAQQTATVTVKTPAFILLVDDDRFYDIESHYKNALSDLGYAYDVWDTRDGAGPGISTLGMYSMTIWATGYDWYQPLTAQDEANLTVYLDRGGRLFLSSQDYLYVRGLRSFGIDYLGILSYTNDITATTVSGVTGEIVGDGLGPFTLTMPYDGFKEWSDQLSPKPLASSSFLNIYGVPTGLTNLDGGGSGRTVFFSFPFEGLSPGPANAVMERVIERALAVDVKANVRRPGKDDDELRYEISLFNSGSVTTTWTITGTVPVSTTYVSGSAAGGATYDAGLNQIRWQGYLAPGETKFLSYRVSVLGNPGDTIVNTTYFDPVGGGVFQRRVSTPVTFDLYFPTIMVGNGG